MENNEQNSEDKIRIQLPVKVDYLALVDYLQQNIVGEIIKAENKNGKVSNYAEILDASFEASNNEAYDLALDVHFRTLTTLYKNKTGRAIIHISLEFDEQAQEITVGTFNIDMKTGNWLMNNSLETVANRIMYNRIKKKMLFNFTPHINKFLPVLNEKLGNNLELTEGVYMFGYLDKFKITEFIPKSDHFLLLVDFEGNTAVEIKKIDF